ARTAATGCAEGAVREREEVNHWQGAVIRGAVQRRRNGNWALLNEDADAIFSVPGALMPSSSVPTTWPPACAARTANRPAVRRPARRRSISWQPAASIAWRPASTSELKMMLNGASQEVQRLNGGGQKAEMAKY